MDFDSRSTWILIVVVVILYLFSKWERSYFTRRGVKSIPYSIPFVGNMLNVVLRKEHLKDRVYKLYNAFPDQKYVGHMQFNNALFMIRDLDILKQVVIKDFDNFLNHFGGIDHEIDPMFGNNLFFMTGDKWKYMRSTLSPAFTSSKMRNMFVYVEEIAREMSNHFLEQMKKSENRVRGYMEIEMKDLFTRYTNDVIASSVFGFKVNSFKDRDNDFYIKGGEAANFTNSQFLRFLFMTSFPNVSKMLKIRLFRDSVSNYFRSLVLGNISEREKKGIVRHDMIQLLMDAQKGTLKHEAQSAEDKDAGFATVKESQVGLVESDKRWTDDEVVAQALLFFLAGFETSATVLSFMGHELTIHPEVQRKLQNEIDEMIAQHGSKLEYNQLSEMKYMDMVVSETLRMWPPVAATDRTCTKPYKLPPPDDKSPGVQLNVGDNIWIPVYGIHFDPQYYENPTKFDPERFSDENKHKIKPMSYLPFGGGPRNCIGSRFALMEIKAVMFHLLANFDFLEIAKTQNPITLTNDSFNMRPSKGFWFGLKPRVK